MVKTAGRRPSQTCSTCGNVFLIWPKTPPGTTLCPSCRYPKGHHTDREKAPYTTCDLDDILLTHHPKCKSCRILVGEHHMEKQLFDVQGDQLCGYCAQQAAQRQP